MVDRDSGRRSAAESLGATRDSIEPGVARVPGEWGVVVDATPEGDGSGFRLTLRSTAPGGTCTTVQVHLGAATALPLS